MIEGKKFHDVSEIETNNIFGNGMTEAVENAIKNTVHKVPSKEEKETEKKWRNSIININVQ